MAEVPLVTEAEERRTRTRAQQQAARQWREGQLGAATIRAANWRYMAYGLLVTLVLSAVGNLILITQYRNPPPRQPDVLVLDPQGNTLWQGKPGSYEVHDLYVASRIKQWIKWCRARPDDLTVMGDDWTACLNMTVDAAHQKMEVFQRERHPNLPQFRQNPMRVRIPPHGPGSIQVKRRSAKLYDVDWIETWTPKVGHRMMPVPVAASITVDFRPQPSPLGTGLWRLTAGQHNEAELAIYVIDFELTETLEAQP